MHETHDMNRSNEKMDGEAFEASTSAIPSHHHWHRSCGFKQASDHNLLNHLSQADHLSDMPRDNIIFIPQHV